MTTLFDSLKECGCCGNTISVTAVGSTNAFGSPDLDLRPPEMKRSALLKSIQYCGHCGYDVARRAGEFETACRLLERFDRCKVSEPLLKQIACFHKQLLDNEDVSCYTVQEAISGSQS